MASSDDGGTDPTLQRSRSIPPPGTRSAYALLVNSGPDRGKRIFFDESLPPKVLVGTSPVCHLRLSDGEVSRRHAAFSVEAEGLRLTDLGSTNGTRVAGVRVLDALLAGGQLVTIGATELKVLEVPVKDGSVAPPREGDGFGRMVGKSELMRRVFRACERAAAAADPVLIEGETGTGKELLAECLHEEGPRAQGPFVVVDCATLTASDVDAALFGVEGERPGAIEAADGGTLVLDEIGELELGAQAKLLRAIERAEVRRVGAVAPKRVDVRIVTTTRRDLDKLVQSGAMRDDLYFRIAVLRIELPPLRARPDDAALLADHFYRAQGGEGPLPDDLVARVEGASTWPGNVRELQNTVARRLAMGDLRGGPRPAASGAADSIDRVLDLDLAFPAARERVVAEFERRYVERVLSQHGGNVARAAAASGIARRYFQIVRARQRTRGDETP